MEYVAENSAFGQYITELKQSKIENKDQIENNQQNQLDLFKELSQALNKSSDENNDNEQIDENGDDKQEVVNELFAALKKRKIVKEETFGDSDNEDEKSTPIENNNINNEGQIENQLNLETIQLDKPIILENKIIEKRNEEEENEEKSELQKQQQSSNENGEFESNYFLNEFCCLIISSGFIFEQQQSTTNEIKINNWMIDGFSEKENWISISISIFISLVITFLVYALLILRIYDEDFGLELKIIGFLALNTLNFIVVQNSFRGIFEKIMLKRKKTKSLKILERFLKRSQILDNVVDKTLKTIQEIELISHGFRLASNSNASALSNIEQEGLSNTNSRSVHLRIALSNVLEQIDGFFRVFENEKLFEKNNSSQQQSQQLSSLLELKDLRYNYRHSRSFLFWKLNGFLRGELNSTELKSSLKKEEIAFQFVKKLEKENVVLKSFTKKLESILAPVTWMSPSSPNNSNLTTSPQTPVRQMGFLLNQLKAQVQSSLTRLTLCEQALLRIVNQQDQNGNDNGLLTKEVFDEVKMQYESARKELLASIELHHLGSSLVNRYSSPEQVQNSQQIQQIQPETKKEQEEVVLDSVNYFDQLSVPNQTFEAYVTGKHDSESDEEDEKIGQKRKMERIDEFSRNAMVQELQSVLHHRNKQ